MSDLTKKDIQELLDKKIDPFARTVQQEFQKIDQRFGSVENRLGSVEDRLGRVEADVQWMKNNMSELFTKLDKFITLYEDQRQELASLAAQMSRLEQRIEKLETKQ